MFSATHLTRSGILILSICLFLLHGCSPNSLSTAQGGSAAETGISFPSLASSSNAGYINGEFSVGSFGTPSYSIPIEAPPGTNGVSPSLSICYQNTSQNGILGLGWQLNGLSVISRTGKIIPQDSVKGGVDFSYNDRFSLNGQRLIAYKDAAGNLLTDVSSRAAAYGGNGTEYRTEVESWIRIWSVDTCGNGPCSFIAEAKDGTAMEFAVSDDARIQPDSSPAVVVWAVNKITDRNGNYVEVSYQEDETNGSWMPLQVRYTGNESAELPPQRLIEFAYEAREDSIERYLAGIPLDLNQRLVSIQTFVDQDGDGDSVNDETNLVKSYQLHYGYSAATGRSLLDSIVESDASGVSYPASQFSWSQAGLTPSFTDTLVALPANYVKVLDDDVAKVKADFNADGIIDIALLENNASTIPTLFANGSGGFTLAEVDAPSGFSQYFNEDDVETLTGDFNADGKTDIYLFKEQSSSVPILIAEDDQTFSGRTVELPDGFYNYTNNGDATVLPCDFNGDGFTDFAAFVPDLTIVPVLLGDSSGDFVGITPELPSVVLDYMTATDASQETADFNGDGLADFVAFSSNATKCPMLFSNGSDGFTATRIAFPSTVSQYVNAEDVERLIGDFNGDGLADLSVFENGLGSIPLLYSKGDGSFEGLKFEIPGGNSQEFTDDDVFRTLGDINGDGVTDFTAFASNRTDIPALISQSQGDFDYQKFTLTDDMANSLNAVDVDRFIGDFNGDGLMDIAALQTGFDSLPILFANSAATQNNLPDLLIGIDNGIGAVTTINYNPLTDTSVCPEAADVSYPQYSQALTQFVVSGYQIEDASTNGTTQLHYSLQYGGPVIDQFRGYLGLESRLVLDPQIHSVTESQYQLEFPFNGLETATLIWDLENRDECLGKEFSEYASNNDQGTGTWHLWNSSWFRDHYTYGNYNFTLQKDFWYDSLQRNIVRVDDLSDTSSSLDDVFTYMDYASIDVDDEDWWKACFPSNEKALTDTSQGVNWDEWVEDTDLYWHSFGYDGRMNTTEQFSWLDNPGDGGTAGWTGSIRSYDPVGNNIWTAAPPNQGSDSIVVKTIWDSTYFSFEHILISAVPQPHQAGSDSLVRYMQYDPRFGNAVLQVDPNGNIRYSIPDEGQDGFGRIVRQERTRPDEDELVVDSLFTYSLLGGGGYTVESQSPVDWDLAEEPDSNWRYEKSIYDGMARKTASFTNGNSTTQSRVEQIVYDSSGQVSTVYVPYFQDTSSELPLGNGSFFVGQEYDEYGILREIYEPAADSSGSFVLAKQISFDSLDNRIIWLCRPSPSEDSGYVYYQQVYDARGLQISQAGPYDSIGVEGDGFGRSYTVYDRLQREVERIDPLGQVTQMTYNSLGAEILRYDPVRDSVVTVFNHNGWVEAIQTSVGTIGWEYDDLGRQLYKFTEESGGDIDTIAQYLYDDATYTENPAGRLCKLTLENQITTYSYDKEGNPVTQEIAAGELESTFSEAYDFDAAGRPITTVLPTGDQIKYTYGQNGATAAILLNNDTVSTYSHYNALGLVEAVNFGNGVSSQLGYDLLGRMAKSSSSIGAFEQLKFSYSWNKANKLRAIDDERTEQETQLNQAFTYLQAGQLGFASGAYGSESYTYDVAGNRASNNSGTYHYSDATRHELGSISMDGITIARYGYTSNGNLNSKELLNSTGEDSSSLEFQFDVQGYLIEVKQTNISGDTSILGAFSYSETGKRISKWDSNGTLSYYLSENYDLVVTPDTTTLYTISVIDDYGLVFSQTQTLSSSDLLSSAEVQSKLSFVPTLPSSPSLISQLGKILPAIVLLLLLGALLKLLLQSDWKSPRLAFKKVYRAFRLGSLILATSLLTFQSGNATLEAGSNGPGIPESGETRYFQRNHIGSTVLVTDENGGVTNSLVFKPFGELDEDLSTGTNNFRAKFTGQETDAYTSLQYFGSRYYDAALGRFISPDPADQFFSPYLYADDDPLAQVDPDGEFAIVIALVVGAIVGAYVGASLANGSFDPTHWDFSSASTWIGLISGAAAGVAVVAGGAAALSMLGAVSAESVAIGSTSASTIAFTSLDASFLVSDAYNFSQNPTVANGIWLGLDLLPLAGALIGRAAKGVRASRELGSLSKIDEMEQTAQSSSRSFDDFACPLSFVGGTSISTPTGLQTIEGIQVGQLVQAWDFEADEMRNMAVTRTFERVAEGLIEIFAGEDTLFATHQHPFFSPDLGWVEAAFLQKGDRISGLGCPPGSRREFDGELSDCNVSIDSVHWIPDTLVRVFNFEVQRVHNYHVGKDGLLVHNPKCPTKTKGHWKDSHHHRRRKVDLRSTIRGQDVGTGTSTNKKVRDYSNHPNTRVPKYVKYSYTVEDASGAQIRQYRGRKLRNKIPQGQKADAGHVIGSQMGGSGTSRRNIFPQNISLNRGWGGRHRQWRFREDKVRNYAQNGNTVRLKVSLYY